MKGTIKKLLLLIVSIITLSTVAYAADIMPPTGSFTIENASLEEGMYYTITNDLILNIEASDNETNTNDIKVLLSNETLTIEELTSGDWENYEAKKNYKLQGEVGDTVQIYMYLQDAAGNIASPNVLEATTKYTITYVAGEERAMNVPEAGEAILGKPFTLPAREPRMKEKYFWGWSMEENATTESWRSEDVIEARFVKSNITLYAVWGDTPKSMADVVKVGDFVEYPVSYENISTHPAGEGQDGYETLKSTMTGWRVLDITDGVVKLISAGTPIHAYMLSNATEIKENFLTYSYFGTSGFEDDLETVFDNVYTDKVEPLTAEDFTKLTGETNLLGLDISKFGGLLNNGTYYCIIDVEKHNELYDQAIYTPGLVPSKEKLETAIGGFYCIRPVITLSKEVKLTRRNAAGNWVIEMPKVEVSFVTDGETLKKSNVTYNGEYGELPTPQKENHRFMGWYTEEQGGTLITENSKVTVTGSQTLYAHYDEMIVSKANEPLLGLGMKAVYWSNIDNQTEYTVAKFTESMYNYNMGDGRTDSKESKWANAKTEDGSYWVWIPRYAYKITYYEDETKYIESDEKTLYGNIDIIFLSGTSNKYIDKNGVEQSLPEGYIVHPAFQSMTAAEREEGLNPLGKWDNELTGMWVAKYEAGREYNNETKSYAYVSKPNLSSYSGTPSDTYAAGLTINETLNSHEMKNSEWGAVAYLTHSTYGRNGNEISVNIKGRDDAINCDTNGTTTGNIYGIYDMSGKGMEFTATYINNGASQLQSAGASLVNSTDLKTKQEYQKGASWSDQLGYYNANTNVYGDAIFEVSTTLKNAWNNDYMDFPFGSYNFFARGGEYNHGENAGMFSLVKCMGGSHNATFRAVLCFESYPYLSNAAEVGDYVNYPVEYTNVSASSQTATLAGWRVISKDVDLDGNPAPGVVNLISAGTPLSYNNGDGLSTADELVEKLVANFLTTSYTSNGFNSANLKEELTNEYTLLDESGNPEVRSIIKADIETIHSDYVGKKYMDFKDDDLFAIPSETEGKYAHYWIATKYDDAQIYRISNDGSANSYGQYTQGVRPVVSIKPGAMVTGKSGNTWVLLGEEQEEIEITYDGNGGTQVNTGLGKVTVTASLSGTYEDAGIPEVEREGYTFLGWYTAAEGGEQITSETKVDIAIKTLYAHWGIPIPEGGTYYRGVTSNKRGDYTGDAVTTYTAGENFPATVETGDVYVYGDYEYRRGMLYTGSKWLSAERIAGWGVRVLDNNQTSYGEILESINNIDITCVEHTFYGCENLTDISGLVIPSSATSLWWTFANCTSLVDTGDFIIPNNITDMRTTFYGCTSLTDISGLVIPDGVKDMGSAFHGCTSLTDISGLTIPNNVEQIASIFRECTGLTDVSGLVIPNSVWNLEYAFEGCTSLTGTITINANPTFWTRCLYNTQITSIIGETTMADDIMLTKTSTETNPTAE